MDVEALIAELIADGTPPREAARIAAATVRSTQNNAAQERETAAIQRVASSDLSQVPSADSPVRSPSYMVRSDGRVPVHYGDETPREAEERWSAQERMDPQGVYSDGGMSGGGIFGGGPVGTATYDPGAHQRGAPMAQARVQLETLHVLQEMRRDMEQLRSERDAALLESQNREAHRFTGGRGQARQLAGKKKPR